jgi:hypothetical protein
MVELQRSDSDSVREDTQLICNIGNKTSLIKVQVMLVELSQLQHRINRGAR